MIHIRSCSDSAAALIDLLKYVLSEGDLQQQNPTQEVSRSSTPIERKRSDRPIRMYSEETLNSEHSSNHDVSRIKSIWASFHFVFRVRIKCFC